MNKAIIRDVVYPAYRALRRDRVLEHLAGMRRLQRAAPEDIRRMQWDKLRALLEHASRHVPYYRKIFADLGATPREIATPEHFSRFPVLRKADIRANTDALIAETRHADRLTREETGGSTGENLSFYVDFLSGKTRLANNAVMNEWLGVRVGDRLAYLWGQRFRETARERRIRAMKHWLSNTLYISAYRMDRESVRRHLARLRRFKPDLVVGYPSALHHFCEEAVALGGCGFRPRAVLVSGETVYDWQRAVIEQALGAPVYGHYGCCEFGAVARECNAHDGLHIAASRVLVEAGAAWGVEDAAGASELVITDLDNYGMPFIRYAIEDLGTVTWEPCACGMTLPRIRDLVGRVYDIVQAPNGNFLSGTFWGHVLKEGVQQFQVVQEALDRITIAIVPAGQFDDGARAYALDKIRQACGPEMQVRFDVRQSIEPTRTGKHRYVISKVALPASGAGGAERG